MQVGFTSQANLDGARIHALMPNLKWILNSILLRIFQPVYSRKMYRQCDVQMELNLTVLCQDYQEGFSLKKTLGQGTGLVIIGNFYSHLLNAMHVDQHAHRLSNAYSTCIYSGLFHTAQSTAEQHWSQVLPLPDHITPTLHEQEVHLTHPNKGILLAAVVRPSVVPCYDARVGCSFVLYYTYQQKLFVM